MDRMAIATTVTVPVNIDERLLATPPLHSSLCHLYMSHSTDIRIIDNIATHNHYKNFLSEIRKMKLQRVLHCLGKVLYNTIKIY